MITKSLILLMIATTSLLAAPNGSEISVVPNPRSLTQLSGAPHQLNAQTRILYQGTGAQAEDNTLLMKNYPRRKEALQVLKNNLVGVWVQE
jgi:hypothetical protein